MQYNITSGEICTDVLYYVAGEKSVIYNLKTYFSGEYFRGINNVTTFNYSGIGSQELYEVAEFKGFALEYIEGNYDQPIYPEVTNLLGGAIEFELTESEKKVNEVTVINAFALELIDSPFYSFEIIETRL
ncbi:hypothetical protein [Mucilaginibacter phyllosphaerae]